MKDQSDAQRLSQLESQFEQQSLVQFRPELSQFQMLSQPQEQLQPGPQTESKIQSQVYTQSKEQPQMASQSQLQSQPQQLSQSQSNSLSQERVQFDPKLFQPVISQQEAVSNSQSLPHRFNNQFKLTQPPVEITFGAIPKDNYILNNYREYYRNRHYKLCVALSFRQSSNSRDYVIGNNTLKSLLYLGESVLPFVINNRNDYDVCNFPEINKRIFCTNKVM